MTEELFREDAYTRRCEARVVAIEGGKRVSRSHRVLSDRRRSAGRSRVADARGRWRARGGRHGQGRAGHRPPAGRDQQAACRRCTPARRDRLAAPPPADADAQRHASALRRGRLPGNGGQVGEAKSRLDFDLQGALVDKDEVALRIARWIAEDHPIRHRWIDALELEARPDCGRAHVGAPAQDRRQGPAGRDRGARPPGLRRGRMCAQPARSARSPLGKLENKGRQNRRVNISLAD